MEARRRGVTANYRVSRPGPSGRRLRRWRSLTSAALGLAILLSSSCYGRFLLHKLPPETSASPVAVAVTVNPAPGREDINYLESMGLNAGPAKLEEAASTLRGKLSGRRGFVVVGSADSADVIVEVRGLYDPRGDILASHHVWGAVYAARNPRVPLGSPYAVESMPKGWHPPTVGGAVKDFAADVETIVADNFEMIASLRSRPIGDTSPIEPTATAPLQGEYRLAVTPSSSCPAPSAGAMRRDYDVSLYQHGSALLLLVRGLCRDQDLFTCLDKMRGQVVGDEITLRSTYTSDFLPTGPTADGGRWEGKGSGRVIEDRIEVTVVGKVFLWREGKQRYKCEAADHRWTLMRRM